MSEDLIGCAIVGGGPAGLTAATYLGRFRQRTVVFDDGRSRALIIPRTRNVPGFPDGISGPDLHARMVKQAENYGAEIVREHVTSISKRDGGFFLRCGDRSYRASAIILATGVAVSDPTIENLSRAIAEGVVRYCPVCDGYETQGKRIAVLGAKPASIEEAAFLTTYSTHVTLLPCNKPFDLSEEQRDVAERHGITIETRAPARLSLVDGGIAAEFLDGQTARFDVLYPCLGSRPRSELAIALGAEISPTGGLLVDSRQQTNLPMLYAAGDVLEGLDQIASGCGQAAIAATTIHNHLRQR